MARLFYSVEGKRYYFCGHVLRLLTVGHDSLKIPAMFGVAYREGAALFLFINLYSVFFFHYLLRWLYSVEGKRGDMSSG